MTTTEILGLLALQGAYARPSRNGPEWHEIVVKGDREIPLPAAEFDQLKASGFIEAENEGVFILTAQGRRQVVGDQDA